MNEYQKKALQLKMKSTRPPDIFDEKLKVYDFILGLVGESGEIADKFKKLIRDHNADEDLMDKEDIKKELGDVLWYIAVLSDYLGFDLQDVADTNLQKLTDRLKNGTIGGNGDHR